MPRRRSPRRVVAPPNFKGYSPYGARRGRREAVDLLYEEYEAIKLTDYDGLIHDEAAKIMGVSRPTFARIYESARKKIARALVETRGIKSVYGNAMMDKTWYICHECHARFTVPEEDTDSCPVCKSKKTETLKK